MQLWVTISRLADLVLRRRRDARLDEEIATHLALLRADHERRGLSPAEAESAARRSFGGVDQVKAHHRDTRGWPALEALTQDVRFAGRYLVRDRAFALPVVLVLALGIGIGHLYLTVTYAHILRGLPIEDITRVLAISTVDARGSYSGVSYPEFLDLRRAQRAFVDLAAYTNAPITIADEGQVPDRLQGVYTTASGFAAAGVRPILGRTFSSADESGAASPTVVVTERIWHSRYQGDPSLVGRDVLVNGITAAVVGIVSDRSGFPSGAAVFLPLQMFPGLAEAPRDARILRAFGRLAVGATLAAAQAEVAGAGATLARQFPSSNQEVRLLAEPINYRLLGGAWAVRGYLPFITAGLVVLAVAGLNAGNLLLAGAASRAREVAVRTALGASRLRIVRQFLVEAMLMATAAALLGMAVSRAGVASHSQRIPDGTLPYWFDYSLNLWLLAALAAMGLLTIVLFAVLPAVQASRTAVVGVLKDGGRSDTGSRTRALGGSLFLGLQLGLAVVLVAQIGIATVTRNDSLATDRRFDDRRVLTGTVTLPAARYSATPARRLFLTNLLERTRALPAVVDVALASHGPVAGSFERLLATAEVPATGGAPQPAVQVVEVSPRYFATLDIGVLRGQEFTGSAAGDDSRVLVNERLAAVHFAGVDPVGRRLSLSRQGEPASARWHTVVGVVPDIRHGPGQTGAVPVAYTALLGTAPANVTLFVRSAGDGAALTAGVRESLRQLDGLVPLDRARSLAVATRDATWAARASASFATTVCSSAIVLAATGLYAVISHRIARRRREIGLRLALGADARRLAGIVVGSIAGAVAGGLVLGVIGVLAWNRAFASPPDASGVTAIGGTLVALAAVVLLGCAVPVARTLRIAPAEALRRE